MTTHSPLGPKARRVLETTPLYEAGRLVDLVVLVDGKPRRVSGRGGAEREIQAALNALSVPDSLPVLLGAGAGFGLDALLEAGAERVVVVDKEIDLAEASGLAARVKDDPRVVWIADADRLAVDRALAKIALDAGFMRLVPVAHPFYLRLDPEFYRFLKDRLEAGTKADFRSALGYTRFKDAFPRLLMITSRYFLLGEVEAACKRLGVPHRMLALESDELGRAEFIEDLLQAVVEFKPDCVFTINHLGVDREGALVELLAALKLPLISWFVDNPQLVLHRYAKVVSDWTAIFSWDRDNLPGLKAMGFAHVAWAPLAVDHTRFVPPARIPQSHPLKSDVGFVGNSMLYKVGLRLKAAKPPKVLLSRFREIAARFGDDPEAGVAPWLEKNEPELFAAFNALGDQERALAFETAVIWEATRQYRLACVRETLPFDPVICGDPGWKIAFRKEGKPPRLHPELSYYDELPLFYPLQTINFNCTSKQMKGAVNQRVFDAPAAGGFVLTDFREQMAELFDLGREAAVYDDPSEIGEKLRYWLDHPAERARIVGAARERILKDHTYDIRLSGMLNEIKRMYG